MFVQLPSLTFLFLLNYQITRHQKEIHEETAKTDLPVSLNGFHSPGNPEKKENCYKFPCYWTL